MFDAGNLTAIFTGLIALLTFFLWRSYKRIEWLTGALESHSMLMLRIEASRLQTDKGDSVRLIWWDPDEEALPAPTHGAEAKLETLRLYLPLKARKGWREASRARKIWRWINAEI
jgi:hypothetical protein